MNWIILLVFLPFILIICGILVFNIYLRRQVTKETIPIPALDQAYIDAENAAPEEEEVRGFSEKVENRGGKS